MVNVGFDFGTHQTKICIEDRSDKRRPKYSFMKFEDLQGVEQYVLPSVIQVKKDGTLCYGYVASNEHVYRYFKQATFASYAWNSSIEATLLSIWYVANILFLLNEKFGNTYSIQIGVPMGDEKSKFAKERAVSVFLTAFDLVENIFNNDKAKFLETPINTLKRLTKWKPYSKKMKDFYSLSVFPEAYASLLPITTKRRLVNGMNLLVDIGGGTTDISFFVVSGNEKIKEPLIYHYQSISKGINSIIEDATPNIKDRMIQHLSLDSQGIDRTLLKLAVNKYIQSVQEVCNNLISRLRKEYFEVRRDGAEFNRSVANRPIVYTGGGSTFKSLQKSFLGFSEIFQTEASIWSDKHIPQISEIQEKKLAPILSVALGLSITQNSDEITLYKIPDLYKEMRKARQLEDLLGKRDYLLADD